MENSEIETLIKDHEAGIKILNNIKLINKDIETYTFVAIGIADVFLFSAGAVDMVESKINELTHQKTKLVNKYKLI